MTKKVSAETLANLAKGRAKLAAMHGKAKDIKVKPVKVPAAKVKAQMPRSTVAKKAAKGKI